MNSCFLDFTKEDRGWYVLNDGVMGGESTSELFKIAEGLQFKGRVSLENNGGFASFRSPNQKLNLSSYTSVEIKYRSTGIGMHFQLNTSEKYDDPKYKVPLSQSEEWQVALFPLHQVPQYRMSRPTGKRITPDDLESIIRLGFITSEKREGDFLFEVSYIQFQ